MGFYVIIVPRIVDRGSLSRQQMAGEYVYVWERLARRQLAARKREALTQATCHGGGDEPSDEVTDHLGTFLATLNEQQRRLYLGFESFKLINVLWQAQAFL